MTTKAVVRISKGRFGSPLREEARRLLVDSESALRDALTALPGLIHYYVGIDEEGGQLTNVSVWDSSEHALQMNSFAPMLAQRPILESAGIEFEPITNHEVLWSITP